MSGAQPSVTIYPDGPLVVRGDVEIRDADGQPVETGAAHAVALCRCGRSARKPLCDGSHKSANGDRGAQAGGRRGLDRR